MKKRAIIVGSSGQDGTLLYSLLSKKGYALIGIGRGNIKCNINWRNLKVDITNKQDVFKVIREFKPNEIYYLAAYHHSSEEDVPSNLDLFYNSYQINVIPLLYFLEGISLFSKKSRLFYASSSHIFGSSRKIQDEKSPLNPINIYGLTKAYGLLACRYYRINHSVFASVGILFNHESVFRKSTFLSKKIVLGAINIKQNKKNKLVIGNLHAEVDWGYAPDYVDAMYKILQLKNPGEFIIATGKKHKVIEFVEEVFNRLNLNWKEFVEEDPKIIKKKSAVLLGNPKKLMKMTSWKPKTSFRDMARNLLEGVLNDKRKDGCRYKQN